MYHCMYAKSSQPNRETKTAARHVLVLKRKKGEGGHEIDERKCVKQDTRGGRCSSFANGWQGRKKVCECLFCCRIFNVILSYLTVCRRVNVDMLSTVFHGFLSALLCIDSLTVHWLCSTPLSRFHLTSISASLHSNSSKCGEHTLAWV